MSTLTIKLSDDQAARLKCKADEMGQTVEEIVEAQITEALSKPIGEPWEKLIGSIEGSPDLSMRKGYSTSVPKMVVSAEPVEEPWMKYIGCVEGPEDLSTREGFDPQ